MKNNSTLVILISTLSILIVTTFSTVCAQEDKTYSKEPKFYAIQRILPDIDIFVDK